MIARSMRVRSLSVAASEPRHRMSAGMLLQLWTAGSSMGGFDRWEACGWPVRARGSEGRLDAPSGGGKVEAHAQTVELHRDL